MKRQNFASDSAQYGFSRAAKVKQTLYIARTVGVEDTTGKLPESPVVALDQITKYWQAPLHETEASINDIGQLTRFMMENSVFSAIGPRLGENFGEIRPTDAALVATFPIPGALLELQAIAEIGCCGGGN